MYWSMLTVMMIAYFSGVQAVGIKITGPPRHHVRLGENLTLNCIIPTEIEAQATTVDWYFTPAGQTGGRRDLYTYWLIPEAIPQRRFHDNTFLDTSVEPPTSIRIIGAQTNNTGLYECRVGGVDNMEDKQNITVIQLPSVNLTTSFDDDEMVEVGQELEANCSISKGYPEPDIHWTLDGKKYEIEDTEKEQDGDWKTLKSTLTVESNHLGKEFGCRAVVRGAGLEFVVKETYFLTQKTADSQKNKTDGENSSSRTLASTFLLLVTASLLLLSS